MYTLYVWYTCMYICGVVLLLIDYYELLPVVIIAYVTV